MKPLVCPHCKAELEVELSLSARLRPAPAVETWRDIPLAEMALSARAYNCLAYKELNKDGEWVSPGPRTAGDVAALSDGDLLRFCNFGRKSLAEVREVIAALKEAHG
jgi:DNA-directed RNA polymerase alpha subunit